VLYRSRRSDRHQARSDRPPLLTDGQTAYSTSPTACPGTEALDPVLGTRGRARVMAAKLLASTLFGNSVGKNLWLDLNRDTLPHDYFRYQRQELHHGLIRRHAGRSSQDN
jgi:hypothetical protein